MNRSVLTLALAALSLTLGACVSSPVYDTALKVTEATSVQRDDYKKVTWIKSPIVTYNTSRDRCYLRYLVADTGQEMGQLYLVYTPSDWAFLQSASDRAGQTFEVTTIDKKVSSGRWGVSLAEHVAVNLSRAYQDEAAKDGLDIKVFGKGGSTVVKLPPHYVQGFLDQVNLQGVPSYDVPQ